MLKPKPLYLAIILLGLAAGVLRALELRYVYGVVTGLALPEHPITLALIGACVFAVPLCLVPAFKNRFTEGGDAGGARVPMVLAALILAGGSVADVLDMMENGVTLTQAALAALGLLTAAVLMVMVTTVSAKLTQGMFATIAVFWSSFWLLLLFAANAGNPIYGQFIYEFMAVLFSVLAFYFFAGCHFGKERVRLLVFVQCMGVFFLLLTLIGTFGAWFFFQDDALLYGVTMSGQMRMLFSVIYLLCMPSLTRRALQMPDEEPEDDEDEYEEDEE